MIKSKWMGSIAAVCMVLCLLVIVAAYARPELFAAASGQAEMPYAAQMDASGVLDIQISVSPADWESMLKNAREKQYIPATVTINGVAIQNVGIRPKGNSSLSAAAEEEKGRYSFKIEFDHYIDGQTWMGLDKLCLNNMYSDASYMKEYLSFDIMRYSGVDTPLYAYADISVNGETWGFYLAVEAVEDSFAARNYGSNPGAIYKPDVIKGDGNNFVMEGNPDGMQMQLAQGNGPIDGAQRQPEGAQLQPGGAGMARGGAQSAPGGNQGGGMVLFGGPGEGDEALLPPREGEKRMMVGGGGGSNPANALQYIDDDVSSYATIFENAVFNTTPAQRQRLIEALKSLNGGTELEAYVNVDAVLRYLAAHTVVVNLDSYVSNMVHNYYLREEDGRISMIPWDYNMAFGGFSSPTQMNVVNFPIDTPVDEMVALEDRPLIAKLLEVPEYKARYHAFLRDIVQGYFESGVFERTFVQMSALIAEHVRNDPRSFYTQEAFEAAIPVLGELIALRAQSVIGQLEGTVPSTWAGQKENPDALVDASHISMEALGGGGDAIAMAMVNGVALAVSKFETQDIGVLGEAVRIIQDANGAELSEEQLRHLLSLGLRESDIEAIQTSVGDTGGAGGPDGNQMHWNENYASNPSKSMLERAGEGADAGGVVFANLIMLCSSIAVLVAGLVFAYAFRRSRG